MLNAAFAPGEPVQPVCFFFNNNAFNFGMTSAGPSLPALALRVLCQINNNMSVHFLPAYRPSAEEKSDPKLYAKNVRRVMAEYMKVPTTKHSYDDVCLQIEAMKVARAELSADASDIELKSLKSIVEIDKDGAKELVKAFIRMDMNRSGRLDLAQFKRLFEGPFSRTPVVDVEHLFHLLDKDDVGTLNLKEVRRRLRTLRHCAQLRHILSLTSRPARSSCSAWPCSTLTALGRRPRTRP